MRVINSNHGRTLEHKKPAGKRTEILQQSGANRKQNVIALQAKNIDPATSLRARTGLRLLFDAYNYARRLNRVCWEFAEEIKSLRHQGLTNGDLRWLVCNGFVEHGRETTEAGQPVRKFQIAKGLSFSKKTCFVLTEKGASHVIQNSLNSSLNGTALPKSLESMSGVSLAPQVPTWDRERQELRVGATIVKQFKVPARNQETILAVFEEEEWPVYIDDPLPRHPEIDPKRRLHDTINSLNRSQKNHLIQFRGNGSGEGVRWEFFESL